MAFGQHSGPPATSKQVRDLLALVQAAGHADFRDARGPLQLTQRQAAGRFTRDEADELIERLEAADEEHPGPARPPVARPTASELALRKYSAEQLAAELQRRGWIVAEP